MRIIFSKGFVCLLIVFICGCTNKRQIRFQTLGEIENERIKTSNVKKVEIDEYHFIGDTGNLPLPYRRNAYEYDSSGKLLIHEAYYERIPKNGILEYPQDVYIYSYDSIDRLVCKLQIHHFEDTSRGIFGIFFDTSRTVYTYNKNGYLLSETYYSETGKILSIEYYTYDTIGRIIKWALLTRPITTIKDTILCLLKEYNYEYLDGGKKRICRWISEKDTGTYSKICFHPTFTGYFETSYNKSVGLSNIYKYYDKRGFLIETQVKHDKGDITRYSYSYIFDKKGNPIEKKEIVKGKIYEILKYRYEYFK
ncbi:MAG: hypothetical protein HY964_07575 [Ignavibacteriales bacterium]|nr:hypothetical protein [Ignavibacteriales bacterium]